MKKTTDSNWELLEKWWTPSKPWSWNTHQACSWDKLEEK